MNFRRCRGLLLDEILELCDTANLLITGGGIDVGFLFLFPELEDLISDIVVVLALANLVQELLLKLEQMLIAVGTDTTVRYDSELRAIE